MATTAAPIAMPALAPTESVSDTALGAVVTAAVGPVAVLEVLEIEFDVVDDTVDVVLELVAVSSIIRNPGLEMESAVSENVTLEGKNRSTQYCVAASSALGTCTRHTDVMDRLTCTLSINH